MKQFGIPLAVPLSEQVIFDHIVQHFKDQKVPCVEVLHCRYRSKDMQRACAIGSIFLNEEYVSSMDIVGKSVQDLGDLLPKRYKPYISFLSILQKIHDYPIDTGHEALISSQVAFKLKRVGDLYKLDTSKVDWE